MAKTTRARLLMGAALSSAVCLAATGCGSSGAESDASAECGAGGPDDFPRQPIELTVAFPAGGGQDIVARTIGAVGEEVSETQFRVVNREGAAGLSGHTWFANEAAKEGYNVLVTLNPFLFIDLLIKDGEFSKEDIIPIAGAATDPVLHLVNTNSQFGDMDYEEILEYASENPGSVNVGVDPDNVFQFATEAVEEASQVEFNHVDFDGGAPGMQALLGEHIDMTSGFYAEAVSYIDSGDLKVVAAGRPSEQLPDVPSFDEFGVAPDNPVTAVQRFVAIPAGVDEERAEYLTDLFDCILNSDAAAPAFEKVGMEVSPVSPEDIKSTYEQDWEYLSELWSDRP